MANQAGLDPAKLKRHLAETGSIAGAPGTEPIDNETLLALDVDLLVLAALEGQITSRHSGDDVSAMREAAGIDPRLAAHAIALSRVADPQQIRGRYP